MTDMCGQANQQLIKMRHYGDDGPRVLVLHGGPAAPGYMVPIARRLAKHFCVIEPFQRHSCADESLTVQRHVEDLHAVIGAVCHRQRPMLVGHSWGAMLALAYAAAHPGSVTGIVLIGCGSFDAASRARMQATRNERIDAEMRRRMDRLAEKYPDPNRRLGAMGRLIQEIDSYDLVSLGSKIVSCDAKAHEQTWEDMVRLQDAGVYPAAFEAIGVPVLMLHGDDDPHPGQMIRDQLTAVMPQLEYTSWPQCGHYPWLEKSAFGDFYTVLTDWLLKQTDSLHL